MCNQKDITKKEVVYVLCSVIVLSGIVEYFCLLIKWCANSVTSSNEHNNLRVKILRATKAIRETGTEIKSYYKDYIVIKTKICTKIKHYDKNARLIKKARFWLYLHFLCLVGVHSRILRQKSKNCSPRLP